MAGWLSGTLMILTHTLIEDWSFRPKHLPEATAISLSVISAVEQSGRIKIEEE